MKIKSTTVITLLCCCLMINLSVLNTFAFDKVNGESEKLNSSVSTAGPLVLNATPTAPSCYGGTNGSIQLSVSGGTSPYTYQWSNGRTIKNLNNVKAGNFSVTVTDATGLVASTQTTVPQGYQIIGYMSCNNVCKDACNGVIDLEFYPPGTSTTGWTYNWSHNGGTTQDMTGLCAGTYAVTVTTDQGCKATFYGLIGSNPSISLSVNKTDNSCYKSCDGTASASVSGGTAPFNYIWSPGGATTSSISNLCAGTYCVTVVDYFGCTKTDCVVITEPNPLELIPRKTDLKCYQSCDGSAAVTVNGGTAPYTYSWTGHAGTSNEITGLCAGTYCVSVTDQNGCGGSVCIEVKQPNAIVFTNIGSKNVSCYKYCDGSATVSVSGGTAPYTYKWNDASGSTGSSISGLCAGTYCVTVTDKNGCTATDCVVVTEPAVLALNINGNDASCYQACDGNATANVTGGTAPYNYHWSNTSVNSNNINNLCPGTYCVTVTDKNGCTTDGCVVIGGTLHPLVIEKSVKGQSCFDKCDGQASVSVSGGTAPYTYKWNNATGPTDSALSNLCAGTYCVTVTDKNGCTASDCLVVTKPEQLICYADCPQLLCYGDNNGVANVTANGGTAPYTYKWSANGQTTQSISGLSAGTYCVTVTDQNGCVCVSCRILTQPEELVLNKSKKDQSCYETCDGSASVSASGGTAPYTYKWNDAAGSTGNSISGLCAGTYCVTVTDAHGCTKSVCVEISKPSQLSFEKGSKNQSCYETCDGSATVSAFGGTAPYTYNWNNGSNNNSISGLCAGTYCVTITDAHGCTKSECFVITKPSQLTIKKDKKDVSCYDACDGKVIVIVSGGTAPYTYHWNNSQATTGMLSGLCAGTYCVTVTDKNGCTISECVEITQPEPLKAEGRGTNQSCYETCDGTATVAASGGTAPYTYNWNNGSNNNSISGLCAGTYCVTVTDAHGCTKKECVEIGKPKQIGLKLSKKDVTCKGYCDGTASVEASGGTAPYTYNWSNNENGTDISGLCAGTYCVTVTDQHGCTASGCIVVAEPPAIVIIQQCDHNHCAGQCIGAIPTQVSGGTPPYTFNWSDGQTIQSATGLCDGTYSLTVTDQNGCTQTAFMPIHTLGAMQISMSKTDETCAGACDGTATVSVSPSAPDKYGHQGGIGPYTYLWSNGETDATVDNLCTGTYCVTVTDYYGCTAEACIEIVGPPGLIIIPNCYCENNHCAGLCEGKIFVDVYGGAEPYTYLWSNGQTTKDATGLCDGPYFLTVTDANGCTASIFMPIQSDNPIILSTSVVNAGNCNIPGDCIGSVDLTVTDGTAPYAYNWSNGATTEDISGLCAGTYSVTVTDYFGCTSSATAVVKCNDNPGPCEVSISGEIMDTKCGRCVGAIDITVSGFNGTQTYAWSNGATTEDISGLCAGTYSVTVTEGQCSTTGIFIINDSPAIDMEVSSTDNTTSTDCQTNCNGTASVSVSTEGSFTYLWSNGSTDASISGLCGGTYCVTVTDSYGCTKSDCVVVKCIPVCNVQVNVTGTECTSSNNCQTGCNGTATANATGGNGSYTYHWANGASTKSISGLCGGTYCVTVTDANKCTASGCVVIKCTPVCNLAITLNHTDCTSSGNCGNGCNGTASVTVSNGNYPYKYKWSNGKTTQSINGLCGGQYCVTVTDNKGCVETGCVYVTCHPIVCKLKVSACVKNVSCYGAKNGKVTLTVSYGTSPYTYNWSNGATTKNLTGVSGGTYKVTVTDKAGCSAVASAVVSEPTNIVINATVTNCSKNRTCSNSYGCNGKITLSVTGGSGGYIYKWSNGQCVKNLYDLCGGQYCVTVTDCKGCYTVKCFTVVCNASRLEDETTDINITDGFNLNAYPNPFSTQVNIEFTSSVDTHGTLEVYNVIGMKVAEVYTGEIVSDQQYNFQIHTDNLPSGMYTVRLVTEQGVYTKNIVRMK